MYFLHLKVVDTVDNMVYQIKFPGSWFVIDCVLINLFISGFVKQVTDICGDLSQTNYYLDELQRKISGFVSVTLHAKYCFLYF